MVARLAVVVTGLVCSALGFYLPGVHPHEYEDGELVSLKVNKLTSIRTHLPYDFYFLPFCKPDNTINDSENLGEILGGDAIKSSAFEIRMGEEVSCKVLCRKTYTQKQLRQFEKMIQEEYHVNWIVDNLPSVWYDAYTALLQDQAEATLRYDGGFPLGVKRAVEIGGKVRHQHFVNNHVRILLKYHTEPTLFEGKRIVGFMVAPFSVEHSFDDEGELTTCDADGTLSGEPGQSVDTHAPDSSKPLGAQQREVVWTYDVRWEYSPIRWASRWDMYLSGVDNQVHWFSIVNSLVIVLFLTGLVAMIMNRTLHRDIARYNQIDLSEEDALDESGWKSVYGEVFRPPQRADLLSVLVGTGVQLLAMVVLTLGFAVLGLLSPANRGGLMTCMLVLFAFMGFFAGYASARLHKTLLGKRWLATSLKTATLVPGFVFAVFFVLNLIIWGEKSSGAVPFSTMFSILALWFCISLPLVLLGSWVGYLKPAVEPPVTVMSMPREPIHPPGLLSSLASVLLGGVLPFGVVFIEVFFILSSIWLGQYYYAFFFLFVVLAIMCVTCAEISIVLCYFQLCRQDYHWWWRAFFTSGASGVYLFAYSLFYLRKLQFVRTVSSVLFVGYMLLASVVMSITTGVVGFLATLAFVHAIYGAIKLN